MKKEITIGPVRREEESWLRTIEESCFKFDAFPRQRFHYLLTRSKGVFLVAREETRALGYICCLARAGGRTLRVYSLAVLPEVQGQGVGARLLESAIAWARENGKTAISLEVKVTNEVAIALYRKFGFWKTGYRELYYRDASDAYVMRREL